MSAWAAEAAPAKVNLHLHVTGRRPDGYHLLDSLVVFAGVGDVVRARAGEGFAVAGPEAGALAAEGDNLVLRAARALAQAAGVSAPVGLALDKHLPVASGIGGGSADAAAALRLLNRLWGLGWPEERLAALALPLGADVPACVASRPCRMGGIGEALAPAPRLPAFGLVLVNPRVALATPAVFRARDGDFSAPAALPAGWADAAALARDLGALRNDLEAPAIGLCPPVAEVLDALRALPGCLLARMSGSGATCFGLFAQAAGAAEAAGRLPAAWWRWGGGLHAPPG
ncbi:4-(cytidine 5'-diphospho)-2-C-methyl-D-erythritol kinase [Roseomonas sp. PWR1]|uniref:4-diphosphocytidyl-2-C-methyl-D-erythritol kinase n=1 Tax=Roseomonas nitratireducens TaxID=2820810 RepID=A0ABS4AV22_9PROT|nr:4-(cytidine 5'-diphospho)-2-C-methyl-D-erythritol kinase [Neoroseomonas nitratireducens]MBP0465213.1 4-(cytidine 5'-diphospho)-2-C-methyl-D-erythritol kinase [Neoroseomonas nitratireducens]